MRNALLNLALFGVLLSAAVARAGEMPHQRAGKYEVSIRLPPEGLYAQEEMQIEFRVVDSSQVDPLLGPTPVVRARIQGTIEMPSMPGMPKYEELAHPEGIPGEYGVHPTFAHGGEYRLQLAIAPPADAAFTVNFPLEVRDATDARRRKAGPLPFQLELRSSPKNPKTGQPVDLLIAVHARERPKEVYSTFEVVHEKRMHLLIVRSDLSHFAHEHPVQGSDGIFRLHYSFPAGGEYHLFADVAPAGAGSQLLMAKIKVSGEAGEKFDVARATAEDRALAKKVEGVEIGFPSASSSLPFGKTIAVSLFLKDAATGRPITDLEPYVGAMGHLLLIHQDSVTFVHSHPDERQPDVGRNGTVPFLVRFPKPGIYRGWAQFQRHGQVLTGDFIVQVREESGQGAAK